MTTYLKVEETEGTTMKGRKKNAWYSKTSESSRLEGMALVKIQVIYNLLRK